MQPVEIKRIDQDRRYMWAKKIGAGIFPSPAVDLQRVKLRKEVDES